VPATLFEWALLAGVIALLAGFLLLVIVLAYLEERSQ